MKIKKISLNKKLSKNSQIKIQEMSFMIIAVFVFFVLVLLFYLSFSMSNLKTNVDTSTRSKNILLLSALAGTPEFSCPSSEVSCVDEDKLLALKNHPVYSSFWDVNGLVVKIIYPPLNSTKYSNPVKEVECTPLNYPDCNKFTLVSPRNSTLSDSSFVSVCRREKNTYTYDKCSLGKIFVWTVAT